MDKQELRALINVASGKRKADFVIKNCNVIDIYNNKLIKGDIAISGKYIAGIGDYNGIEELDAKGKYASAGFIDSHIHVESSYVSPEELGRMVVPHGTTTIIADPHEIANVCGITGLRYMIEAANHTALDIRYVMPSCVPATDFEHAGAVIDAESMVESFEKNDILGLGEFMNFPGVIHAEDEVLDKLLLAIRSGKVIDGHSPGVSGKELNAYSAAHILTDHECSTVEEMQERISRGMYVLMRQGSACHDLRTLLKGVTNDNIGNCLLCSDDRQPKTILDEGHIDAHLRICVEEGIRPFDAIRMATINAAKCYRLYDRGAIAPGKIADIVLFDSLGDFDIKQVFIGGELIAENGKYLKKFDKADISSVKESFHVKDFSIKKLEMNLNTSRVNVIEIVPGGVLTKKTVTNVPLDEKGDFIFRSDTDIAKIAVIERHKGTGNVACGFLKGYGIKRGAVALSIAHDSHNIITVGVSNEEMEAAVRYLIEQGGGIVLVKDGRVIERMPMPIAGLMSDKSGEWVAEKLVSIHERAYKDLGINGNTEPVMTLCFMALPVIPELKLTDVGLFDVKHFNFITVEAV